MPKRSAKLTAFAVAGFVSAHDNHTLLISFGGVITINPLVFVYAALMAIVITALTVGFQAARSALMNPVESLRSE